MYRILFKLSLVIKGCTRLVRAHTAKTTIDRRVDRPAFDRSRTRRGSSLDMNPFMPHNSDPSPTSWHEDSSSPNSGSYGD